MRVSGRPMRELEVTTLKPSELLRFADYPCARLRATISEIGRVRPISDGFGEAVFNALIASSVAIGDCVDRIGRFLPSVLPI